jgi:hypothetical protein
MIAPIIGGGLLVIDRSFPVYFAVGTFAMAGVFALLLKEDERAGDKEGGGMHGH